MKELTLTQGVVVLILLLTKLVGVDTTRAFVTPGLPPCYVSLSQYEYLQNLYTRCEHNITAGYTRQHCGNGNEYYFYCSCDYDCCFHEGCPACCTKRNYMNTEEIAGVVIACIAFTAVILIITYFIVGRFCKLKAGD